MTIFLSPKKKEVKKPVAPKEVKVVKVKVEKPEETTNEAE